MDTEKCAALLCALQEGTITKAAERLGYTVSGISKMIAVLEQEAGFPLLLRSKAGVLPTAECRELLPYLRQLTDAAEACRQITDGIKGIHRGKVCVGSSYQSYLKIFARTVSTFRRDYPDIHVELISDTSSNLGQLLARGQADLCLISERKGFERFTAIGKDEILAWVPDTPEYRELDRFPVERLSRVPYISMYPEEETDNSILLHRLGIEVRTAYSAAEVYGALSLVEAGLGVALINRMLAQEITGRVIALPLDPPQFLNIGIAERGTLSPAARKFREYLADSL